MGRKRLKGSRKKQRPAGSGGKAPASAFPAETFAHLNPGACEPEKSGRDRQAKIRNFLYALGLSSTTAFATIECLDRRSRADDPVAAPSSVEALHVDGADAVTGRVARRELLDERGLHPSPDLYWDFERQRDEEDLPDDPETHFGTALVLIERGELDDAQSLLERLTGLTRSQQAQRECLLARIAFMNGADSAHVRRLYQSALQFQPSCAMALHFLARDAEREGDSALAEEYQDRLVEALSRPKTELGQAQLAQALFDRSRFRRELGQLNGAEADLDRGQRLLDGAGLRHSPEWVRAVASAATGSSAVTPSSSVHLTPIEVLDPAETTEVREAKELASRGELLDAAEALEDVADQLLDRATEDPLAEWAWTELRKEAGAYRLAAAEDPGVDPEGR